ncbi:hypothetical protein GCM10011607_12600 [Shewanella inventionis]|uniref:Uncharacterized protein n=1 Tax=Shewanella inventionis TaxID=1738770 RepID=A0ABQ1IYF5_9GAMM|nr:hypothetical protein [Shewanella inventionis]GGB53517.1 hypothetical protein GCM10011607_12600 [Shewanella inventionis]
MEHYIVTNVDFFSKSEKKQAISAIIAAVHDINHKNSHPIALTFNANVDLGEIDSITKIGLVGEENSLIQANSSRLALLNQDLGIIFTTPKKFDGDEPLIYLRSKPELDPAGYQGQVKKRAINTAKRLARLGTPETVAQLHAKHMTNLFTLQKTTPHLRIRQRSNSNDRLFNLCIIKVPEIQPAHWSRKADIYGLRQVVRLLN